MDGCKLNLDSVNLPFDLLPFLLSLFSGFLGKLPELVCGVLNVVGGLFKVSECMSYVQSVRVAYLPALFLRGRLESRTAPRVALFARGM